MAQALKELGRGLNQAWQNVSEGWRELVSRGSAALTRFSRRRSDDKEGIAVVQSFPEWGMAAGEVIDKDKSIVVHVELPGIARQDCDIRIEDRTLFVRGEKRMDREHVGDTYYVMERAYGSFKRAIPLPADVDPESAQASLRDDILRVGLTKKPSAARRRITVT